MLIKAKCVCIRLSSKLAIPQCSEGGNQFQGKELNNNVMFQSKALAESVAINSMQTIIIALPFH